MRVPLGAVALRMPLFHEPGEELRDAVSPPWPRWLLDVYGIEDNVDPGIDAAHGQTTISAALAALAERLRHRLQLLASIAGGLEAQGWALHIDGGSLVASRVAHPTHALELLEQAGLAGPLCAVADLDDNGWPRLYPGLATTP